MLILKNTDIKKIIYRFSSLDELEAAGKRITRFSFPEKTSIENGTW